MEESNDYDLSNLTEPDPKKLADREQELRQKAIATIKKKKEEESKGLTAAEEELRQKAIATIKKKKETA